MRYSLITAAATAMIVSAPDPAPAQVRAFPSINTSPYANVGHYYPGYYYYPGYAFGYGYSYPGYQAWSYGWSSPNPTWSYSWPGYNPYFYTGYGPLGYAW